MHTPSNHPANLNGLAGKARRFVTRSRATRHIRLDQKADSTLLFACRELSNPENPVDTVSCSLAVRRALQVYSRHLDRVRLDPATLWNEREAVRALSKMPGRPRRKMILN